MFHYTEITYHLQSVHIELPYLCLIYVNEIITRLSRWQQVDHNVINVSQLIMGKGSLSPTSDSFISIRLKFFNALPKRVRSLKPEGLKCRWRSGWLLTSFTPSKSFLIPWIPLAKLCCHLLNSCTYDHSFVHCVHKKF